MKRAILSFLAVTLLSACASPDPTYYNLRPVPGPQAQTAAHIIEVRKPGLAGYLDRADLVLGTADYHLAVAKNANWGEPLGDMIGRILTEDLQQRLPNAGVHGDSGAISADPDLRVEVNINRFDASGGGTVVLRADVAVEAGISHHALTAHTIALEAPASPGPAGLAAAMSTLLGALADHISADIQHAP